MRASEVFADVRTAELAEAAADGNAARVRELVAAGAQVDARGAKGTTPLQWALYRHSLPGMRALLAAGADPSVAAQDGMTAVHLAAMADDPGYLRLLLEHGADPNARNAVTQATPLASALMAERAENVGALLKAGAQPGLADRTGNTPLHQAAKINEFGHALSLLRAGADPAARNDQGVSFQRYMFMTPDKLLNARTRGERDAVIAWLREHGVAIERTERP
ncbi:ankyrin repeat domain-containing protein [Pseudomonas sp. CGJS7]|uniref:ankyrin repeat domain-containing protein n=1 Tax=Pseudomonas sp. CGJS7 TaxID=3109348 RepID=UPI003009BED5